MIIKVNEIACKTFVDQANQTIAQGGGITLIDTSKQLQPNTNYLITIHKIATTPDIVVSPTGDNSEEHS